MRVAVAGALVLGGFLLSVLAESYNGAWLLGLLAMAAGTWVFYRAAE